MSMDTKDLNKILAKRIQQHIMSHTSQTSRIYSMNARLVQHPKVNQYNKIQNSVDHLKRQNVLTKTSLFLIKTPKLGIEGKFLNLMKGIYEKSTAKIILNDLRQVYREDSITVRDRVWV